MKKLDNELHIEGLIFIKIGCWKKSEDKIKFSDNAVKELAEDVQKVVKSPNIVYAFVRKDEISQRIMYIGKAENGYKERFARYRNIGGTKATNARCNGKINDALSGSNGQVEIEVYIHAATDHYYSGIFNINLVRSLEQKLVEILKDKDKIQNRKLEDNTCCWNWTETQIDNYNKELIKSLSKHSE